MLGNVSRRAAGRSRPDDAADGFFRAILGNVPRSRRFPLELDRHDRRLLEALQRDARLPVTALADATGLSANATAERLRRLQRAGVIEGFTVRLSAEALGRPLLVFVEVKLERTVPDVFDSFAAAARAADEVLECHMVAGGFDYLVKTRVADMAAYRRFLSGTLLTLPGVRETHTYAVMEEIKVAGTMPL